MAQPPRLALWDGAFGISSALVLGISSALALVTPASLAAMTSLPRTPGCGAAASTGAGAGIGSAVSGSGAAKAATRVDSVVFGSLLASAGTATGIFGGTRRTVTVFTLRGVSGALEPGVTGGVPSLARGGIA